MEKKKVSQLNNLFEKMLSSKLDVKESLELSHLYNEFIEEDRGKFNKTYAKNNVNYNR